MTPETRTVSLKVSDELPVPMTTPGPFKLDMPLRNSSRRFTSQADTINTDYSRLHEKGNFS
jgi:hypothetical protein